MYIIQKGYVRDTAAGGVIFAFCHTGFDVEHFSLSAYVFFASFSVTGEIFVHTLPNWFLFKNKLKTKCENVKMRQNAVVGNLVIIQFCMQAPSECNSSCFQITITAAAAAATTTNDDDNNTGCFDRLAIDTSLHV